MEKNNQPQPGIKRIALIGPESTGKSDLCAKLATHYQTVCVHEYAREYITRLGRSYTLHDIELISNLQLEKELMALKHAARFLFTDTEMIVSKVWALDVFKESPGWFDEKISVEPYDLYLLTMPDLPWIADPVRENGHRRDFFFSWYKNELDIRKLPYEIISGSGKERFTNALKAVEKHFGNQ